MMTTGYLLLFCPPDSVSPLLKYLNSFTQAFRDVLECFTKWLEVPKVISHCDKYPNRISSLYKAILQNRLAAEFYLS